MLIVGLLAVTYVTFSKVANTPKTATAHDGLATHATLLSVREEPKILRDDYHAKCNVETAKASRSSKAARKSPQTKKAIPAVKTRDNSVRDLPARYLVPNRTANLGKNGEARGTKGIEMYAVATAYSGNCKRQGTGPRTATGRDSRTSGIAVDPRVIKLGSLVEIDGVIYLADDTGGSIKGSRVDIRLGSYESAINFGRRRVRMVVYPP
jgi:3D (Asp-Asp-Asp) domain-containing protein